MWILQFFFDVVVYEAFGFPFTAAKNEVSSINLAPNISHPTSTSTLSLPLTKISTTTTNALYIKCDGDPYGHNLNITDCIDATLYISSGSEQLAWVDRHTYFRDAHYALPYRYMGGKSPFLSFFPNPHA